jgi:hypothetical protein
MPIIPTALVILTCACRLATRSGGAALGATCVAHDGEKQEAIGGWLRFKARLRPKSDR